MIQVIVKGLGVDNITGSPILLLANKENEKEIFPIWIGVPEAEGIMISQTGNKLPRPLTYELFKDVIEKLDSFVKAVEIVDKVNNAYIANIVIEQNGKDIYIDARPSDAVNLALRFNAPIFLNEDVVEKIDWNDIQQNTQPTSQEKEEESISDKELEEFKKFIENVKPDDFLLGKGEAV